MSRIGKKPIMLPSGVAVTVAEGRMRVSGPKGSLTMPLRPEVSAAVDGDTLTISVVSSARKAPAYWGLTRSLASRMVEGVSRGFERQLDIEGIGYRAMLDGDVLQLTLGFSHPVRVEPPPGISFRVEKNAVIVSGVDHVLVGDVAARLRALRPPEPYKGKGIRYAGEVIRRKAGKKAVTSGG